MSVTSWVAAVAGLLLAGPAVAGGLLAPGEPFPAWNLLDHTGTPVKSIDLRGKTYLLWYYPKAMTPGCTKEGCAIRDSFAEFTKRGVEVLGVSFDDPKSNAEFVKKENFPFRLLSDTERSLGVQVGAADSPGRLFARRISYLVGPDGKVLKAYEKVDPSTHASEVLTDIDALSR
jgi:peroxiredoxin Q/BCP